MLIELLRKRRSIRQFEDREVEQEKIDVLVEAMLRSPSSRSLNPWEFVVVTDRDKIKTLSCAKPHGATFMQHAPLAVVVLGDPDKCDVWVEDCSIATLLLHLTACDLGLGSCWIQIRNRDHTAAVTAEDFVKKELGVPENFRVEAIVAIGYGQEELDGRPESSLLRERVNFESYGKKGK